MSDIPPPLSETLQAQFGELRVAYRRQIRDRFTTLTQLWQAVQAQPDDSTSWEQLHRLCHSLAGSGTTFGYPELSRVARSLELRLVITLQQDKPPLTPSFWLLLSQAVLDLQAQLQADAAQDSLKAQTATELPRPLILLLEDDAELATYLQLRLQDAGYAVEWLDSLVPLEAFLQDHTPVAIIADMIMPEGNAAEAIARYQQQEAIAIPVFFMSVEAGLVARLRAMRAGGRAYFTKPIDVALLLDQLAAATSVFSQGRVLVVDDDTLLAEHYASVLGMAGFEVRIAHNPADVLPLLDEFRPELILLDLYLPDCNGLELAQVIRHQPSYVNISIVFLTVETDSDTRNAAVQVGAEDYLIKPIAAQTLIQCIQARITRLRQLREQSTTLQRLQDDNRKLQYLALSDGLTQVANRRGFDEFLAQEWLQLSQEQQPISLILCDVDHFKSFNDTYGHLEGDHCLQAIAQALRQVTHLSTDLVARYGGEEFAVLLPRTSSSGAERVAAHIQAQVRSLAIPHAQSSISHYVTLSMGVACVIPQPLIAPDTLILAADQALYTAKAAGRDRVIIHP